MSELQAGHDYNFHHLTIIKLITNILSSDRTSTHNDADSLAQTFSFSSSPNSRPQCRNKHSGLQFYGIEATTSSSHSSRNSTMGSDVNIVENCPF